MKTYFSRLNLFSGLVICFLLSAVSITRAQPVLHNFQTAFGSNQQATISAPGGIIEGHLLVAGIALEKGNGVNITPPTGWVLIRRTNNSSDCGLATYYKVATASEPVSYTFNFNTSGKWAAGITRLSYVSYTSPIDTSSEAIGNGSAVTAPSLTCRGPNRRVLCFYTSKKGVLFTPDPLTVEIYDAPNTADGQPANMMANFVQNNTGATGARTAIPVDPESWAAQQVAITPFSLLPVELVEFDAVACNNNKAACVSWTTATETNNDFFTVERSEDGYEWKGIIHLQGAGNSSAPRSYFTEDLQVPAGMNYYRLRQTDYDGTTTVSEPVALLMKPLQTLTGFPNPVSSTIQLRGDFPKGMLRVRLFDSSGKLFMDTPIENSAREESGMLTISLPEAPAGTYLLVVASDDGNTYQEMRIQMQ